MANRLAGFTSSPRIRAIVALAVVIVTGTGIWLWATRGEESTDDAQVDARVTQIASRVSASVLRVAVADNEAVEAGAVLVELDPRDYQVALDRARAQLADAEAAATAAQANVPITSTTAASNVSTARGSVEQARSAVEGAQKEVEAAQARLVAAKARQREAEANAAKAARDVERLKGLLEKDEISRHQYDAVAATAQAQRAAADSAVAQVAEADATIRVAESRLVQARAGERQASASLKTAQTGPEQIMAMKARAAAAQAQVEQAKAALKQAELNLEYTVIKAPVRSVVSKKSVNPGQVVQAGQPLLALVELGDVWITANFKETQLADMRPGQPATIEVDAYGGREFSGRVHSIAAATGARFSLLPPENATGNFVKVVQRVPVKIVLDGSQDPEHLLRPGMSVVPTVHTR
jgi:membrane fusion protein (multidrug efflux system)